jgi:hypothetical protein
LSCKPCGANHDNPLKKTANTAAAHPSPPQGKTLNAGAATAPSTHASIALRWDESLERFVRGRYAYHTCLIGVKHQALFQYRLSEGHFKFTDRLIRVVRPGEQHPD